MTAEPADRERLEEFAVRLVDAWGEVVSAYLDRMVPIVRAAAEMVEDPQVQAALAAREFARSLREYRPCHCLCGHAHPADKGICDMTAVTSRHFDAPALGPVDVPLCAPCAEAQGIAVPPAGLEGGREVKPGTAAGAPRQ